MSLISVQRPAYPRQLYISNLSDAVTFSQTLWTVHQQRLPAYKRPRVALEQAYNDLPHSSVHKSYVTVWRVRIGFYDHSDSDISLILSDLSLIALSLSSLSIRFHRPSTKIATVAQEFPRLNGISGVRLHPTLHLHRITCKSLYRAMTSIISDRYIDISLLLLLLRH